MKASLVFDNREVLIPVSLGTPEEDQCQGSHPDVLGEIASRICYDSLGRDEEGHRRGRSSEKLHQHILEVKNYSVYEHFNFTVTFGHIDVNAVLRTCLNRKGIWFEILDEHRIEVSANLRTILEWDRYSTHTNKTPIDIFIRQTLQNYAMQLAPQIVKHNPICMVHDPAIMQSMMNNSILKPFDTLTADQAWITLYLYGSRGFCYTPDTEILTRSGWKMITEIKDGEMILTMNPETKKARWSENKKLHSFNYAGRIYWMESSQWVSPAVTRDHLMWAAKYDLRDRRGMSIDEIMHKYAQSYRIEEIAGKRFVVDHSIRMEDVCDDKSINIDGYTYDLQLFMSWLGWMATDGNISGDRCRIYQFKEWNHDKIRDIMNMLFQSRWTEGDNYFSINDKRLAEWVIDMIGPLKESRDLSPLYRFSPRLLKSFLDSVVLGDGNSNWNLNSSSQKTHEVIYTSYYHVAQQYQTLLAMIGQSSNIRYDDRVGMKRIMETGQEFENKLVSYVVSIHEDGVSLVKKQHHKTQYYTGKTYCPQTDDGIVFVRRQGMSFWCQNTHEQVRHRFAMSQRSTRYVDESQSDYIIHPLIGKYLEYSDLTIEAKGRMYGRLMKSIKQDRKTYRFLVRELEEFITGPNHPLGTMDKLTARKQARGAARGFLGNALASEMLFSAPVKGWQWILSQRASRHADAEIRLIYEPALAALKSSQYGHFFSSFEMIDSPDGMGRVLK